MFEGIITKGVGSFYTVYSFDENRYYTLRARGVFRKEKITPTVGDRVSFTLEDDENGVMEKIHDRKNILIRPSVSNVSNIIIVASIKDPDIKFSLLDKMIINSSIKDVNIIVCFNKADLSSEEEMKKIEKIYENTKIKMVFTSAEEKKGIEELRSILKGKVSVFMGVSGAGKSSLLNELFPNTNAKTSEVSRKIKRGRHTTRHSELFMYEKGVFIADTPGFSSLEIFDILSQDLWHYYDEFFTYNSCKFNSCIHINEPGCGIKKAVEEGLISEERYENYKYIFKEIEDKEKRMYF